MAHVVRRGLLSMKYLMSSRITLRGIRGAKRGRKTSSLYTLQLSPDNIIPPVLHILLCNFMTII